MLDRKLQVFSMRAVIRHFVTLSFFSVCLSAQTPINILDAGGWFDLRRAPGLNGQALVLEVAASNSHIVIAMAAKSGAEIVVLDSRFAEVARWPVAQRPDYVALAQGVVVLGRRVHGPTPSFTVCRHHIEGAEIGQCVSGTRWPVSIHGADADLFAVSDEFIGVADFQARTVKESPVRRLSGDGPTLSAATGKSVVRLKATTLEVYAFDTEAGTEIVTSFLSPELSLHRSERKPSELLISHVILPQKEEIWLVRGRRNIFQGIPIDRFNRAGQHLGTMLVKLPAFADFKYPPGTRSHVGNPTGHMRASFLLEFGDRLIAIDRFEARCAWFDIAKAVRK